MPVGDGVISTRGATASSALRSISCPRSVNSGTLGRTKSLRLQSRRGELIIPYEQILLVVFLLTDSLQHPYICAHVWLSSHKQQDPSCVPCEDSDIGLAMQ